MARGTEAGGARGLGARASAVARAPARGGARPSGYFEASTRPLPVLVFLLPLVVLYEIGTLLYLTDDAGRVSETVSAHLKLASFFEAFGAFGVYLPGLALVTVLVVQHVLSRDRWRVHPVVPMAMALESVVMVAPLLVLGVALGPTGERAAAAVTGVLAGPWPQRLTIAAGAGLYEELLFRMVLIALVHFVLVDLARLKALVGTGIGVVVSAVAFVAYHDLGSAGGSFDPGQAAFYALAGLYFGVVYVWRGFGVAVGVHTAYDAVVLLLLAPGAPSPGA